MNVCLILNNFINGTYSECLGSLQPIDVVSHLRCGDHLHSLKSFTDYLCDFFDRLDTFHTDFDDLQVLGGKVEGRLHS